MRITLGGGGTDLPSYSSIHEGFFISAAINKYVFLYVNTPAADDLIRVKYSSYEQVETVDDIEHDLVANALRVLKIRDGIEIVSMADIPDGTGMGSSGSYIVGLLTALNALKKHQMPIQALAGTAADIEMNMAGHPVGVQDHYVSAFGGINSYTVSKHGEVSVNPLRITADTADALRSTLLLYYTGKRRKASTILGQQDSDTRSGNGEIIESLHATKRIGYEVQDALESGDVARFGGLLDTHWQNKKRRSKLISDSDIDKWYQEAMDAGAWGGKVMGAGGGGFLLLSSPTGHRPAIRARLAGSGMREVPFEFDWEGAKVLVNI
jgi:D-glycero-alpha-D-manno-heptose-7-phosphate kinase